VIVIFPAKFWTQNLWILMFMLHNSIIIGAMFNLKYNRKWSNIILLNLHYFWTVSLCMLLPTCDNRSDFILLEWPLEIKISVSIYQLYLILYI
jgi:hypothetical protein